MEDLHAHTPNLQRLDLDNVWLLSSENFVIGVSGIKELKIKLVPDSVREMDRIGTSMVSWLQYIQCKYNRLEEISILAPQTDIEPIRVINTFEHSIAMMVGVMNTKLAGYGIGVFPLTKTIMDAIDDRNLHLKKITIDDDYGIFSDQLEIILLSKQSKSIKHLEILSYREIRMNDRALYRFLHTLSGRLPSLQHLCISMRIGSSLFLQLLIHLPKLEVLEVDFTCLGHVSSRIEVPVCTIKRLHIRMYVYQGFNVKEINNIIRFAIQACPMLEEFHISGCCYSLSGTVNLWFLDNPLLKLIHVDFGQPDYYTFSMLHGDEEYKDGKHICKLADRNSFNIDIGWRGEDVILDLKNTE
ncbi:hypothetical protein INT47_000759 [Mucor saturninus]|uniref:Uncharacterized protein n=1 Tax=Mucor saturninus TaxID=64648 RepID=A0A8H7QU67_9FUNG|nr:hypothetical protein INT47_000759 [Mucor saturninus]